MAISDITDTQLVKFKVSLRSSTGKNIVIFDASPVVSESRSVQYEPLNVVHLPGNLLAYRNTSNRIFGLNDIKLISRTPKEARKNLTRINILRAWAMPYFGVPGKGTTTAAQQSEYLSKLSPEQLAGLGDLQPDSQSVKIVDTNPLNQTRSEFLNFLGAPPDVLYLSAYAGDGGNNSYEGNINGVSVIITQLEITYPNDCDYIPCGRAKVGEDNFGGTPFPTIMPLTIALQEVHSPREFQRFSIDDYRRGNLFRF